MTLTIWLTIFGIAVLLFLSAFFSGSETALTAVSRARIHQLVRSGSKRAKIVEALISSKERLIGALLLGNNLVNILASSLATYVLIAVFGDTGVVYATLVMTLAVVIFAEVLPKTWAINQPNKFALGVAPLIRPVVILLAPLTGIIQILVRALLRIGGIRTDDARSGLTGIEEIRGTVDLLHSEGEVVKGDRDMLGGILDLSELEVSDVMIHRTRMRTLDTNLAPGELVKAVLDSPYTRLPLYKGDPDEITGVVHAKDVLREIVKVGGDINKVNINKIAAKPWFVPETTSAQSQLSEFLKRKTHFALVVDEYGEVQGLVTLEDILEEIVGDISDEHDIVIEGITKQSDGSYIVDGSIPIRDLNRSLGWDLSDEEATTIAGLVIHEAKTIPDQGQQFTFHGLRIKIMRKSRNRLTQLRITPLLAGAQGTAKSTVDDFDR
ncbi:Co2 transporter containing CBS domains [hydrothermal vent metagenome]|uniref:Co2 transporter containing CBS domains n=1 Tax=hydrothermal vent metagenome TaxID=652676 RepID=A0A3B0UTC0_9ZZZZ